MFYSTYAVGDNKNGFGSTKSGDGVHDTLLGFGIKCASCFIKHKHAGVVIKCASNTNALALTARKPNSALADNSFNTRGKRAYKTFKLRGADCAGNGLIIDLVISKAKGNIAPQRIVG